MGAYLGAHLLCDQGICPGEVLSCVERRVASVAAWARPQHTPYKKPPLKNPILNAFLHFHFCMMKFWSPTGAMFMPKWSCVRRSLDLSWGSTYQLGDLRYIINLCPQIMVLKKNKDEEFGRTQWLFDFSFASTCLFSCTVLSMKMSFGGRSGLAGHVVAAVGVVAENVLVRGHRSTSRVVW